VPGAVLRRDRVEALLPARPSDRELEELLFASKAELEAHDGATLTVSVTPDRLDLLSEGGLGLYLQGATGSARGLAKVEVEPASEEGLRFEVDPAVNGLRPVIAGLLLTSPTDAGLDADTLEEAVRFQELIHGSIGRDRRAASLGIYPFDRLQPPFRYGLEPLADVRFVPLDGTEEVDGSAFFDLHPMAARYGALGRSGDRCLTLRDDADVVLSLPPILNGREGGEARAGDRRLLLESTGVRERPVRESLGLLSVVFLSRGWKATPVPVVGEGPHSGDGRAIVTPRTLFLPAATVRGLAGTAYPASEVEHRLARARLSAHPHPGGWRVDVPPWRPDLMTEVDLAEDVILAEPLRPEDGVVPPSFTAGRRLPASALRRKFSVALLGMGHAQPYTSLLVSDDAVARLRGAHPVRITNPVSTEYSYVRDRLLLSHLEVLRRNTRRSYPQSIGEVGPVIVPDPSAEPGAVTRYHAGVLVASETAGFADAAALVDALLRFVDVGSVREPAELPGTIPGRAARARVAGEAVAEMGEIEPEVVAVIGVPVPVAWAEIDLTALEPLVGLADPK
jgi:phenylalanyl-tRNA synthetase beta chain